MAQLHANDYVGLHGPDSAAQGRNCDHCGSPLTLFARFCGECGASGLNNGPTTNSIKSIVNFAGPPMQTLAPVSSPGDIPNGEFHYPHGGSIPFQTNETPNWQLSKKTSTPKFATVAPQIQHADPRVQSELNKHTVLLARERLILYWHCLVYLAVNLFGFWLSLKAYNEYVADELTRGVIALTPLLFINAIALVFLSPIKNTKNEIHRLKERIKYLRIQIEYENIF